MPTTDLLRRKQPAYGARTVFNLKRCCKRGAEEEFRRDTGFKSILKKSVYFTNQRFRDILMEILNLNENNSISLWLDNLDDFKYLVENNSQAVLDTLNEAFVQTSFCKSISHASLTKKQSESIQTWTLNENAIHEDKINEMMSGQKGEDIDFSDEEEEVQEKEIQFNTNEAELAQSSNQVMNMPVSVHMLDISWIFAETSDGMDHTYGDLMGILENAPRRFIDTQFVRTFIQNLWDDYFWAILKFKLLPQIFYLILTVLYFTFLLFNDGFDGRRPQGLLPGERYSIDFEIIVRIFVILMLLYHLMYEGMQLWRFKMDYFGDAGNIIDLSSICLNGFIIIYHVWNMKFLDAYIILFAAIAMTIMWIQLIRVLTIFDFFAGYLRLTTSLIGTVWPFIILFGVIILMFSNIMYIFYSKYIYHKQKFDDQDQPIPEED